MSESMCEALKWRPAMPGIGRFWVRSCSGRTGYVKASGGGDIHPYGKRAQTNRQLACFYASRPPSGVRQADAEEQAERDHLATAKARFRCRLDPQRSVRVTIAVRCSLMTSTSFLCPFKRRSCICLAGSSPWSVWGRAACRRGTCVSFAHCLRICRKPGRACLSLLEDFVHSVVTAFPHYPCLRCALNVLEDILPLSACDINLKVLPRPWGVQWSAFRQWHRKLCTPVAGQCRRAGPVHEARRQGRGRSRPARRSLAPILQTSGDSRHMLLFKRRGGALLNRNCSIDAPQHAHGNMPWPPAICR